MRIAILHNRDHDSNAEDPGREAREDVVRVAHALSDSLAGRGREVIPVAVDTDVLPAFEALQRIAPDVVFNLCESLAADARGEMLVPSLLELLGLPYTGSPALALGLSLHKHKAKELLAARGVPTPKFCLVETVAGVADVALPFPLIVKPSREDASMGIDFDSVVKDRIQLGKAVAKVIRTFKQPALVEQYIEGREIYVPLLGNHPRRALPLTEIQFGAAFTNRPQVLTYKAKWDAESAECLGSPSVQAQLPKALEEQCIATAQAAFAALDGRDYGRVDLRVTEAGVPMVIDINPNCDLHPDSGFARAARHAGLDYADLALHLLELALERQHGDSSSRPTRPPSVVRAARPHRDVHPGRSGVRARAH